MDLHGLLPVIISQLVTAVALGGVLWQRVASSEAHSADRHEEIKSKLQSLTQQLRAQNGRIDSLEQWRARRQGQEEGYDRAKKRYGPGGEG